MFVFRRLLLTHPPAVCCCFSSSSSNSRSRSNVDGTLLLAACSVVVVVVVMLYLPPPPQPPQPPQPPFYVIGVWWLIIYIWYCILKTTVLRRWKLLYLLVLLDWRWLHIHVRHSSRSQSPSVVAGCLFVCYLPTSILVCLVLVLVFWFFVHSNGIFFALSLSSIIYLSIYLTDVREKYISPTKNPKKATVWCRTVVRHRHSVRIFHYFSRISWLTYNVRANKQTYWLLPLLAVVICLHW